MISPQDPLSRRRFLQWAAGGAAAATLGGCAQIARTAAGSGARGAESPPNFVIILTDDQGYQDLGCYGSPDIRTPNLDRMAAEGVRFTDFYVAACVCSPSRAALLTGCYPPRVSVGTVYSPVSKVGLNPDEVTIAEMLKSRGYATACIGKWHLGHLPPFLPTRQGFDYYFGLPYSNDMSLNRDTMVQEGVPLMRGEKIIEQPAIQETLTQRYTEEAVRFIEKNKSKPFFLYLPHTFPHVPLHASKSFAGRSKRGLYGDAVEEIDWSVGKVCEALKKAGIDERTMVIFASDNGPWLIRGKDGGTALPLRGGKSTAWEGGMRVPCIMRWPGRIPAGAVCKELAGTIDIAPTLGQLAGAALPSDRIIDGKDIWPLISGQPGAKTPHEAYFYYVGAGLHAVRSGKWKLILPHKEAAPSKEKQPQKKMKNQKVSVPLSLYDLESDIGETRDVSAARPDVVQRLLKLAEGARDDMGDTLTKRKGKNVRPAGKA